MNNYLALALLLGAVEIFRRCFLALLHAFTGPLSKVPGPFLAKLSQIPWLTETLKGTQIHSVPKLLEKYGNTVRVAPNIVIFGSKSGIQTILVEEDLKKAPIFDGLRLHPENATLFSETDKASHKHTRRLLSPGFSIGYLNALEPLMQDCIAKFEAYIDTQCAQGNGSATIDMLYLMSNLTFDVMSAASFGGSFDLVAKNNKNLKTAFLAQVVRSTIYSRIPLLKYLPFAPPVLSEDITVLMDEILAKRKARKGPAKRDILQIILDAHQADPISFSENRLRDELNLFMIAGSDTTSGSAINVLIMLLNNQQKLDLLIEEIDKALPTRDDPITIVKTQDLAYLNAVINEAMRILVIPASLARYTTQSTMISNYEIPAETTVYPWPSALMTDPLIWPDPQEFIPERWLGTYKGAETDAKAFLPFSAGTRNCIGKQFAMKELRLILATLLRRYELTLVPGQSHEKRFHGISYLVQKRYDIGIKPRK